MITYVVACPYLLGPLLMCIFTLLVSLVLTLVARLLAFSSLRPTCFSSQSTLR